MNDINTIVLLSTLALVIAIAFARLRKRHLEIGKENALGDFNQMLQLGSAESANALRNAARHFRLADSISASVQKSSELMSREWDFTGSPNESYQDNLRQVMDFLKSDVFTCVRSPSLGAEALFAGFLGADLAMLANQQAAEVKWSVAKDASFSFVQRGGKAWVEIRHPEWVHEAKQLPKKILDWAAGRTSSEPEKVLETFAASIENELLALEGSLTLTGELAIQGQGLDLDLSETFGRIADESFAPIWEGMRYEANGAQILKVKIGSVVGSTSSSADDALKQLLAGSADDLARALGDDAVTIADDALSAGDDIVLSGADDAIGGLLTGALAKIPVLTILHSSWREANLLSKNHTDLQTALRNLAVDATGVGLGAWIGGIIGSIFPGWGTIAGAALGGWLGKLGADKAKKIDYEEALKKYESLSIAATEKQKRESAHLILKMKNVSSKHKVELGIVLESLPAPVVWRPLMAKVAIAVVSEFSSHLERLAHDNFMEHTKESYLKAMPPESWIMRWLGLSAAEIKIDAISTRVSELQAGLRTVASEVPTGASIVREPETALEWVGRSMARVPYADRSGGGLNRLAPLLNSFAELQTALLLAWTRKATSMHYIAAVEILLEGNRGARHYKSEVSPAVQAALEAGDRVKAELRKIGKSKF